MNHFSYNIIGDIHGRDIWKQLVDDNLINVFVGDFFDPYTRRIPFKECMRNFTEIVSYKKQHPENTVLLWGNHELHYLLRNELRERYSRFDYEHADAIGSALEENSCYFSDIAYSIGDRYLITHAGVSRYWYMKWFGRYDGQEPSAVAQDINNLWDLNRAAFSVQANGTFPYDQDSPTQSPLWVRPWALEKHNLFEDTPYIQIFGHTQCSKISEHDKLICVDCLGNALSSNDAVPMTLKISSPIPNSL